MRERKNERGREAEKLKLPPHPMLAHPLLWQVSREGRWGKTLSSSSWLLHTLQKSLRYLQMLLLQCVLGGKLKSDLSSSRGCVRDNHTQQLSTLKSEARRQNAGHRHYAASHLVFSLGRQVLCNLLADEQIEAWRYEVMFPK